MILPGPPLAPQIIAMTTAIDGVEAVVRECQMWGRGYTLGLRDSRGMGSHGSEQRDTGGTESLDFKLRWRRGSEKDGPEKDGPEWRRN